MSLRLTLPRFDRVGPLLRPAGRAGLLALAVAVVLVPDWPSVAERTRAGVAGWIGAQAAEADPARVYVSGAARTDLDALAQAITALGPAATPQAVRDRVEAMAWVETAHVRRHALGPWHIRLEEREPFARWQSDGALWVVDRSGHKITSQRLHRFTDLPLLSGPGAPQAAPAMLALLDQAPDLADRVHALIRMGDRRWDVRFDSGITLALPEPDAAYGPAAAWDEFVSLARAHRLLDREILVVDMRLPERLTLQLTNRGKAMVHAEKRRS
ncbi:hypothetical protein CCR80_01450 [Rhodothalassium salexigens]|uniref:cell division protein FtsQ/DivIB n=1 Tax=Rhodothalassium salexigens TaxID=1086 RepID=UPI001911CCC9|nr:cell division protein FtsQ/DivIB [Rhodothalassium salexigens]MBK5919701.1 hypothetical protein [Rhodothalassium salexigens]